MNVATAKSKETGNTIYTRVETYEAFVLNLAGIEAAIDDFQTTANLGLNDGAEIVREAVLTSLAEMSFEMAITMGNVSGSKVDYLREAKAFHGPMIHARIAKINCQ
jgi:hypothetical protein